MGIASRLLVQVSKLFGVQGQILCSAEGPLVPVHHPELNVVREHSRAPPVEGVQDSVHILPACQGPRRGRRPVAVGREREPLVGRAQLTLSR